MQELLIKLLILSYAVSAIVDTAGYWPTIKDLWLHKKKSANVHSYILWTVTATVAFLYSLFILDDLLFRLFSGMMLFANVLILTLRIRLEFE